MLNDGKSQEVVIASKEFDEIRAKLDNFEQQVREVKDGLSDFKASVTYGKDMPEVKTGISIGWNIISIPLLLQDIRIEAVLSDWDGRVFEFDGTWREPDNVSYKRGYAIKSNIDTTIIIQGYPPPSTKIYLKKGWNLVGYPSLVERLAVDAFDEIKDTVLLVMYYSMGEYLIYPFSSNKDVPQIFSYSLENGNSTQTAKELKVLQVGCSYWVHVKKDIVSSIAN